MCSRSAVVRHHNRPGPQGARAPLSLSIPGDPFRLIVIRDYIIITFPAIKKMKASVVPIGNSKGIRIPKPILEECSIKDEVEIEVEGRTILIRPVKHKPRKNWGKAFRRMHEQDEDELIIDDLLDPDTLDWEW